jgi:hypothetical protein
VDNNKLNVLRPSQLEKGSNRIDEVAKKDKNPNENHIQQSSNSKASCLKPFNLFQKSGGHLDRAQSPTSTLSVSSVSPVPSDPGSIRSGYINNLHSPGENQRIAAIDNNGRSSSLPPSVTDNHSPYISNYESPDNDNIDVVDSKYVCPTPPSDKLSSLRENQHHPPRFPPRNRGGLFTPKIDISQGKKWSRSRSANHVHSSKGDIDMETLEQDVHSVTSINNLKMDNSNQLPPFMSEENSIIQKNNVGRIFEGVGYGGNLEGEGGLFYSPRFKSSFGMLFIYFYFLFFFVRIGFVS